MTTTSCHFCLFNHSLSLIPFRGLLGNLAAAGAPIPEPPPRPPLPGMARTFVSESTPTAHTTTPLPQTETQAARDSSFAKCLRNGLFALALLPDDASPTVIVITDGCVSLPTQAQLDLVLSRFISLQAKCVVLHTGHLDEGAALGQLPDMELISFISRATNGAVFRAADLPTVNSSGGLRSPRRGSHTPPPVITEAGLTRLQQVVLTRTFGLSHVAPDLTVDSGQCQ